MTIKTTVFFLSVNMCLLCFFNIKPISIFFLSNRKKRRHHELLREGRGGGGVEDTSRSERTKNIMIGLIRVGGRLDRWVGVTGWLSVDRCSVG